MKRLIIKTFLTILVPVVIFTFLMIFVKDNMSKYSHEINAGLAYERLDSLKDVNKIVIISGSSAGFGIVSKMLEDEFHMPVVNTATHAGIGIRMSFEIYKDFLKKGDIVIFCPEYNFSTSRLYGESALLRILSNNLPTQYTKISLRQWQHLFKYVGIHFIDAMKHKHCNSPFEGPYSALSINKYGDVECHREHQDIKNDFEYFGSTMDKETIEYYQYIHEFSKCKGITLIHLPPVTMESVYHREGNEEKLKAMEALMKEINTPFQQPPSRYVLPDSLFFDTVYHLTDSGATVRTQRLVEDIKRFLAEQ